MMYTFDEYEALHPATEENQNTNRVTFFSLKDGEEAVIRFMQDDRKDFPIITMHEIMVGNSLRRVGCLATKEDPNCCPLCHSKRVSGTPWGQSVEAKNTVTRVYIKLLQYVPDETGKIIALPKVWDRPIKWVRENIMPCIDNYGVLSDMVCKIRRTGQKVETKYTISPNLSKMMFSDDIYVKNEHAFDNFKLLGGIVLTPTAEEMLEYEQTGVLPRKAPQQSTTTATTTKPTAAATQAQPVAESELPWELPQQQPTMQRPTRMF